MAQWSAHSPLIQEAHSPLIQEAGVRVPVEQAEKFFFFEVTFSKIRCIKVTFQKILTLHAVSKLLFDKTESYTLYRSYCSKNRTLYTVS